MNGLFCLCVPATTYIYTSLIVAIRRQRQMFIRGSDNLENRASVRLCGTCWEPLKTAGQPCDEHLAPQRRLGSLGRLTPRPLKHSHLKKHTAVARATAGKVLASRCARQGQSTRRGLSSPPMK